MKNFSTLDIAKKVDHLLIENIIKLNESMSLDNFLKKRATIDEKFDTNIQYLFAKNFTSECHWINERIEEIKILFFK